MKKIFIVLTLVSFCYSSELILDYTPPSYPVLKYEITKEEKIIGGTLIAINLAALIAILYLNRNIPKERPR